MLPPGHTQTVTTPRRLSTRERRLIGGVLAVVAGIVIVLVISLSAGGSTSGHGCIHATIPGAVGAEEINQCGAQARETCQTAEQPGAFTPQSARVIVAQCRKARLAVGRG